MNIAPCFVSDYEQCSIVYNGSSAAKGGRCLLLVGHDGEHETHGITVWDSVNGMTLDGSQRWHWK